MERTEKNVRLGMTLPIGGADKAVELARAAVDCGYEEVWMAEVNGGDSYAFGRRRRAGAPWDADRDCSRSQRRPARR